MSCADENAVSQNQKNYALWGVNDLGPKSLTPLSSTVGYFLTTFPDPDHPTTRVGLSLNPYVGDTTQQFTYNKTLRSEDGTKCFMRVGDGQVAVLDSSCSSFDRI